VNFKKTFISLGSVMLPKNKSKYDVAAVNASEEFCEDINEPFIILIYLQKQ
jgi:hypothetical protein